MRVMEISGETGAGRILRQQDVLDDVTVENGRIVRRVEEVEHLIFPGRWYPAKGSEGDTYDPATDTVTPFVEPVERIRARKAEQARNEGRKRRVALSPAGPDEYDLFLAVTMAKVYRVARGRGRGQEETELENLMLVVDQMVAIKTAENTIVAEIQASPDPASIDVPNSPHWPS